MLLLLSDENFHGEVVRGVLRREPGINLVRVQDIGLAGADDPSILRWAAENGRVVMSHDRATLPAFAVQRIEAGQPMPGVFLFHDRRAIGSTIEDVLLFALNSEPDKWEGQILYF